MLNFIKNVLKEDYASGSYNLHIKIIRFVTTGCIATSTNIIILFCLTHFLKLWYILSASVAFLTASGVSFIFQKYWTYGDFQKDTIHKQFIFFLSAVTGGLIFNDVFIYFFVEFFGIYYIFAQILSGIIIATVNFFIYKNIFNK